jgi:hypothetical protein
VESHFKLSKKEGYLTITLTGKLDQQGLMNMFDAIRARCIKEGCNKVLIDGKKLSGTELTTSQRFFAGERIARVMVGIMLAIIWPEKDIDGFAEMVATNRGGRMIVTSDPKHARRWLLADPGN